MIPFPKMHIAQSVLNRIENALEGDGPLGNSNRKELDMMALMPAPIEPNPVPTGLAIDEQLLQQQPTNVELSDDQQQNDMVLDSLLGGSLFSGSLAGL